MFYQIAMAQSFRNELLSLPADVARRVNRKIDLLAHDPHSANGDAKKLSGFDDPPLYRVRVGKYRLFYTTKNDWVKLLTVRKRADAYDRPVVYEPLPEAGMPPALADLDDVFDDEADRALLERNSRVPAPAAPAAAPAGRPLPQPITRDLLERLQIAADYHAVLLQARTEEDLLIEALPSAVFDSLIDVLYPRSLHQITQQPELVVEDVSDLDRLLDGELIPFLLRLSDEQLELVERLADGPSLVRGGPGSGKSIVALYRVRNLARAHRTPILFTTFTTTLVSYSRQLLERLLECPLEAAGVTINTVDAVINERYRTSYGKPRIAGDSELRDALARAWLQPRLRELRDASIQAVQRLGSDYLLEEFHTVIDGWGLRSLDEYLHHDRRGRTIALREAERRIVWLLYDAWWHELHRKGLETWAGIRRRALELVRSDPDAPYAAVVIDEAQDLSPTALRFLFHSVANRQGIYLTADTAQSIYGNGFSWQQVDQDLRLRGRSRLLKRNYRNTAQIGRACRRLLQTDANLTSDTLLQEFVYDGPSPQTALVTDDHDEVRQIRAFLVTMGVNEGLPLRAAAILCHSATHGQQLAHLLQQVGVPAAYVERQALDLEQPVVKVMTLYAAKGLEFPTVIVTRVGEGRLPFSFTRLQPEEQALRLDQQRRLLFVGCTRAMRALLVCVQATAPSVLAENLQPPDWQPFVPR